MNARLWTRATPLAIVCLGCVRPEAETRAAATPETARAAVRPPVSREARVEQALARAPHLSRTAAELLVEGSERRGGVWGDPADASLIEASRGFAQMAPADLAELGALFGEAYATLSPADRAAVEGYVERVRRGDAGAADERSRTLLAQGVKSLPEARRARLQMLLESAMRAGFEVDRRTALARQSTPVPAVPATAPPAWARGERDGRPYNRPAGEPAPEARDDEDARLRALGASYKAQIESLDGSIRWGEREVESARKAVESARQTPLSKRPMGDPEVANAERRLADAQEALQRVRNALDDLHTQIRRERIPYSYVQ